MGQVILGLLFYGPLVLTLIAWIKLLRSRSWPRPIALAALGIATANAIFASALSLYDSLKPPGSYLPPGKDPVLALRLLFLFAPIGAVLGLFSIEHGTQRLFSIEHGTPRWLIWVIEGASGVLFLIGLLIVVAS